MRHTYAISLILLLSCGAASAAPGSTTRRIGGNEDQHLAPKPADLMPRAYSFVLAGHYPAAIGTATDRLKINPNDAEALAIQAYAFIKLGQKEKARKPLARALALAVPDSRARAFALVAKATLADADGKPEDALQAFTEAGDADKNVALPYLALADHFVRTGQKDKASILLKAARRMSMTKDEQAALDLAYSQL